MSNMVAKIVALALAAGAIAPPPALADPPIGSRIDRSEKGLTGRYNPRNADSPRPAINAFFRCTASLNRVRAKAALELPYSSDEQRAALERVDSPGWSQDGEEDCFSMLGGGGVRFQYDPISAIGGFAEYFVTREFKAEDAGQLASLSREDWQAAELVARNGSEAFGMCTAEAVGAQVYRLMETEAASAEEKAAIQSIAPALGPCLTKGQEVKFDAAALRAMLAHSLYRSLSGMKALKGAQG